MKLIKNVIIAYYSTDTEIIERLHCAIYCVQVLRIWRTWLHENGLNIDAHFVTTQVWESLELNLVFLIGLVADEKADYIYGITSQANEKFFRRIRSHTGMSYTNLNCTMKSFMHRLNHLEFEDFVMPRLTNLFVPISLKTNIGNAASSCKSHKINSRDFENVVIRALGDATKECKEVGMQCADVLLGTFLKPVDPKNFPVSTQDTEEKLSAALNEREFFFDSDEDENYEEDENEKENPEKNFVDKYKKIDTFEFTSDSSSDSFLTLKDGSRFSKRTLLWLLENQVHKLSNDTHNRFIPRRIIAINILHGSDNLFWKCDNVVKGDYLIVKKNGRFFCGLLVKFKKMNAPTLASSAYNFDSCMLSLSHDIAITLSPLYKIENSGLLEMVELFDYIEVQNYICYASSKLNFSLKDVQDFLSSF